MVESRKRHPEIELKLFEAPGNKTPEALLEALLVWGTRVEVPGKGSEEFHQRVKEFEVLYRGGLVVLDVIPDEDVEKYGPFVLGHYTDPETEQTCILLFLHLGTIIEAISLHSESELKVILRSFAKVVPETIALHSLLKDYGARFPH